MTHSHRSPEIKSAWSSDNLVNLMTAVSKANINLTEQELFKEIAFTMIKHLTSLASQPATPTGGEAIDDVPSCGQESDYRRARSSAESTSLVWHNGAPSKPWSLEWFIAETTFGDRVCLVALTDEWTYDFKTADDTYIKADKIKRWMQFPDSEFIAPAQSAPDPYRDTVRKIAAVRERRMAELRDCLESIAGMRTDEPREPDDADWRFRCLSAVEAAKNTLAHPSTEGK